jgi:cytoskeletal protein CcmA (bactofilin family)
VPAPANDNSGDNTIGSMFDAGFWISQGQISVRAFAEHCRTTGHEMPGPAPFSNPGWQDPEASMVCVTWKEAAEYCAWAGGRLPAEPEWEFAMRGSGGLAVAPTGDTGLVVQGDVLYVKSKWEGPLYFPNYKIVVGPDGSVRGDITGKDVTILGKVVGHTNGTDLIQVRSVGRQYGDMTAGRVLIEDGAYFEGAVKVRRPSPAGGQPIGSPDRLRIDHSITEWCAGSFRDDLKTAEGDLRVTQGDSQRVEPAYWARGRAGLGALNRMATVGFRCVWANAALSS